MKKAVALIVAFLFIQVLYAGEVDTLSVYSASMQTNIPCLVIKPSHYKKLKKKLPVVFLLHGYSGNYRQWFSLAPQLMDKVDELQLLLVCPDGGFSSWWLDSPVD